MSVAQVYRSNVRAVLLTARDLEEALGAGAEDDAVFLTNSLLSSALARESGGTVAGFRADAAAPDPSTAEPSTVEEELALALTELEVGEVLLTSAAATGPQQKLPVAEATYALGQAIDHLDDAASQLTQAGTPPVSGFLGDRQPNPEEFFTRLPSTVDGIVRRTAELGLSAVNGLTKIPVAQFQPVIGAALSVAEEFGALVKAGMRAVDRALEALAKLVPDGLRQQVQDWAKEWWEQHGQGVAEGLARRILSVADLQATISSDVEAAKGRPDLAESLRLGATRLMEIDERHARVIKVIDRIVSALGRLVGPLVAAFPPAAPWIYGTGGGGMVTALGVSVWVGRDYLDAGIPFERVAGVRAIVAEATLVSTQG